MNRVEVEENVPATVVDVQAAIDEANEVEDRRSLLAAIAE